MSIQSFPTFQLTNLPGTVWFEMFKIMARKAKGQPVVNIKCKLRVLSETLDVMRPQIPTLPIAAFLASEVITREHSQAPVEILRTSPGSKRTGEVFALVVMMVFAFFRVLAMTFAYFSPGLSSMSLSKHRPYLSLVDGTYFLFGLVCVVMSKEGRYPTLSALTLLDTATRKASSCSAIGPGRVVSKINSWLPLLALGTATETIRNVRKVLVNSHAGQLGSYL